MDCCGKSIKPVHNSSKKNPARENTSRAGSVMLNSS
jgi:hypothetical protein